MKILYIQKLFAPHNRIAAVRATRLVEYLAKDHNHEITVLSKKPNPCNDLTDQTLSNVFKLKSVHFISIENRIKNKSPKSKNINTFYKYKYYRFFRKHYLLLKEIFSEIKYYIEAMNQIKKTPYVYDYIISSYGPLSSHLIGSKLNKDYKTKWAIEFRDPLYIKGFNDAIWYNVLKKRLLSKWSKKAEIIIIVSHDTKYDSKFYIKNSKKIKIIRNGFYYNDLKFLSGTENIIDDKKKLVFAYTGTLYDMGKFKTNFSILSKLLNELNEINLININNIMMVYAGGYFKLFKKYFENIPSLNIVDYGKLDRIKSLKLQSESDILLLAPWNFKEYQGEVTGKFYEYLISFNKILALVSGNKSESEIKRLINYTNSGFCFEYSDLNSYLPMKKFIIDCYNEKMKLGNLNSRYNYDTIKEFDYKYIAMQLNNILNN